MLDKKLSRKEFLKTGFLGVLALLALPISRLFNVKKNILHKDAKYYKNLAG